VVHTLVDITRLLSVSVVFDTFDCVESIFDFVNGQQSRSRCLSKLNDDALQRLFAVHFATQTSRLGAHLCKHKADKNAL